MSRKDTRLQDEVDYLTNAYEDSTSRRDELEHELQNVKHSLSECRKDYAKLYGESRFVNELIQDYMLQEGSSRQRNAQLSKKVIHLGSQVRNKNKTLKEIRAQLKESVGKARFYEREALACRHNWADFEVEQSRRNLLNENDALKTNLVSALGMLRDSDDAFRDLSHRAALYCSAAKDGFDALHHTPPHRPTAADDTSLAAELANHQMFDAPDSIEIVMPDSYDQEPDQDTPMPELIYSPALLPGPEPSDQDLSAHPSLIAAEWVKLFLRGPSPLQPPSDDDDKLVPDAPRKIARIETASDVSLQTHGQQEEVRESFRDLGTVCRLCGRLLNENTASCKCQGHDELVLNTNGHQAIKEGLALDTLEAEALRQVRMKRQWQDDDDDNKLTRPADEQIQRQIEQLQGQKAAKVPTTFKKGRKIAPIKIKHPSFPGSSSSSSSSGPSNQQLPHIVECGPLQSISTFRHVIDHTRSLRVPAWLAIVLTGTLILFLSLCSWARTTLETRQWMQANEVPVHVMTALRDRRVVSEFEPFQALDEFVREWLEIDRMALG